MERTTYPFPLAAHSSHHSHYHRFLLGADAAVLSPFPKPYCVGALRASLGRLTDPLDLPRWRKLYCGAFPWTEGFGPQHFDLGNIAPHRPLPLSYGRPLRRFGAFDFVQIADPSISALALVAGDQRVLDRFIAVVDDRCAHLQASAAARGPGPAGERSTGRMLAGLFAEPNNRWLMPFLHVHARVLNFTSFGATPGRLHCLNPAPMARAAGKANGDWIRRQGEALSDLGYRVQLRGGSVPVLRVAGVSDRLVAAMEAPRIAVLRLLERIVVGDRPPSLERLGAELPAGVIALMAEQLEAALARSLSFYKPDKIDLPSEGPWRSAVREHVARHCPEALAGLDAAAAQARAVISESAVFSTPSLDPAHIHAPDAEVLTAPHQLPLDPELGAPVPAPRPPLPGSRWLVREFARTLTEVNARIVRGLLDEPLVALRKILPSLDQLAAAADPDQLRESRVFLQAELERRERDISPDEAWARPGGRPERAPLLSLEELFAEVGGPQLACEREHGGRSL